MYIFQAYLVNLVSLGAYLYKIAVAKLKIENALPMSCLSLTSIQNQKIYVSKTRYKMMVYSKCSHLAHTGPSSVSLQINQSRRINYMCVTSIKTSFIFINNFREV